jgi:molecular chaperone DnaK
MQTTHAVGIDLGTTYSCIAYLNEHGEPVTLANQEGELATPSVVLFEDNEVIVGTEALRNAILRPEHVVQNSKRFMGDPDKRWIIDGKPYTPVEIAAFILKKLIGAAQEQIGRIDHAVITVPAQFSEAQRHATVEAGHRAGLQRVDIINEPVAAALCYVLGTEGLWFTELADEQRIMVYDLGGGTFDLSLVRYRKNEVTVIAGAGDLHLGGIDWNNALETAVAEQFAREFGRDPRLDPADRQALALEAEQTKRSLSVRPRAALTCQHAGSRRTYQIEREQFEKLTQPLVERTARITQQMLKDRKMGWAHVDVVLTTGGASRMPMVRERLKQMSGRTLNTSLSPDQSIAHGATYYAGMLLSNDKFARSILNPKAHDRLSQIRQQSVNARALGIVIRDVETNRRIPYYLIPSNTPLPASKTQNFGTVKAGQRRVNLQIIESGTSPDQPAVKLGECLIDGLPLNLPEGSEIAVTIRYDAQARVAVDARDLTSGKAASTEIIRQENLVPQLASDPNENTEATLIPPRPTTARQPAAPAAAAAPARRIDETDEPVPLCNRCGEPLDHRGTCARCGTVAKPAAKAPARSPASAVRSKPATTRTTAPARKPQSAAPRPKQKPAHPGEDEFWQLVE